MSRSLKILSAALLSLSIVYIGCQKKVTKVEPTPEPAPVVKSEPPPPPPPQDTTFKPIEDVDGELKGVLQTIYFDFNRYDLKPEAISTLEKIASFLKDHTTVRVLIEGNCDEKGSEEYNIGLGARRSKAARDYLTTYGIASNRIETTSYGKERPARSNCGEDEGCNSANRRDEWKVLAK